MIEVLLLLLLRRIRCVDVKEARVVRTRWATEGVG
jgi:hypothetical protein